MTSDGDKPIPSSAAVAMGLAYVLSIVLLASVLLTGCGGQSLDDLLNSYPPSCEASHKGCK